jgi:phage protein D
VSSNESKHPDFVVTIAGEDATKETLAWTINDQEEGMSSLMVQVDNRDGKHDGALSKVGETIALRFGHAKNLSSKIEMKILKVKNHFGVDGKRAVYVGLDATQKLSQQSGRAHQRGKDTEERIKEIAKATGTEIEAKDIKKEEKSEAKECSRGPVPAGVKCDELLQHNLDQAAPQKENSGGGGTDVFDKAGDAGSGGQIAEDRESMTGVRPGKNEAEKNRANNAKNGAKSSGVTASLVLIGYPLLKAKKCVTIENVGPDASGKWYVKNCTHSWSHSSGYSTNAALMRSGLGQNGCQGGGQPMVYYAKIYDGKNKIFAGPRQMDEESQETFRFGDGEYIVSFDANVDAQSGRGTGKKVQGKTINPKKASNPVEKIETAIKQESGEQAGAK